MSTRPPRAKGYFADPLATLGTVFTLTDWDAGE